MITIIDYGVGNLKSVQKAFDYLGYPVEVTNDLDKLKNATILVLPGVGAFEEGMAQLTKMGAIPIIKDHIKQKKPFLGICLGFQLLFETSEENGIHQGLGIFKGAVKNFTDRIDSNLKIPHMGWNTLSPIQSHYLKGLPDHPFVYFVHSYFVEAEPDIILSKTTYGLEFVSAIAKDNVLATQFHPEKSGDVGLSILKNFCETHLGKPPSIEKTHRLTLDFTKLQNIKTPVIPVVVQDIESKTVLILAYTNKLALSETLKTRVATFWSTSRQELWVKGATSGNTLDVIDIKVNCEQNSLLYLVKLNGKGACHSLNHNGDPRFSCYYRKIENQNLDFCDE